MSLITSGWLARPTSRRVRLRRSTIILMIAFVGLSTLYFNIRTVEPDLDLDSVVIVATTATVPDSVESTKPVAPAPSTSAAAPSNTEPVSSASAPDTTVTEAIAPVTAALTTEPVGSTTTP